MPPFSGLCSSPPPLPSPRERWRGESKAGWENSKKTRVRMKPNSIYPHSSFFIAYRNRANRQVERSQISLPTATDGWRNNIRSDPRMQSPIHNSQISNIKMFFFLSPSILVKNKNSELEIKNSELEIGNLSRAEAPTTKIHNPKFKFRSWNLPPPSLLPSRPRPAADPWRYEFRVQKILDLLFPNGQATNHISYNTIYQVFY